MKFLFKKNRIIAFTAVFLIIFSLNFFNETVKNFFYNFSYPIQNIFWQTGEKTSDFFSTIGKINNFKKENEELLLKIQELSRENIELKITEKENEELRKSLNLELEKEFELIVADIGGKQGLEDSLLINKGFKDGVSEGMPVITSQKFLVGKIEKTYENFSIIQLLSDKKASLNARIFEENIEGIIKGVGASKVVFDLIPMDSKVEEGDNVLSTGLEGVFPENLLVGKVKNIERNNTASFQKAEINLAFNVKETKTVFVIK